MRTPFHVWKMRWIASPIHTNPPNFPHHKRRLERSIRGEPTLWLVGLSRRDRRRYLPIGSSAGCLLYKELPSVGIFFKTWLTSNVLMCCPSDRVLPPAVGNPEWWLRLQLVDWGFSRRFYWSMFVFTGFICKLFSKGIPLIRSIDGWLTANGTNKHLNKWHK